MKPRSASAVAPRSVGEVRIIGGQWKRSKLAVPVSPGLRPTPDRVRETLFNWLGQDLSGWRCVDAFAGSGALGFEAASRGAKEVFLIESDPALARGLRANAERFHAEHMRVLNGDALAHMSRLAPGVWDVVFLDPPFDVAPLFERAIAQASQLLAPTGYLYLEAPVPWTDAMLAPWGLVLRRQGKAGMVHYHLLERAGASGDNPAP